MGALSQQFALRLMEAVGPLFFNVFLCSCEACWLPRSEWWIRPGGGFWRCVAIISAAKGSSVRMWSRMAQPTTFRLNRSRTTARDSQPSSVGIARCRRPQVGRGGTPWGVRREPLVQQIGRHGQIVIAVRGTDPKGPALFGLDAMAAHQARHPAPADGPAFFAENNVQTGRAVPPAVLAVKALDVAKKTAVLRLARTFGSATPGVVSGGRDIKRAADDANRILFATVLNDAELHFTGPDMMEAVFF